MSDETEFSRAKQRDNNLACVLDCMSGLFGSIAEIINREPGPLRAYAAPLDQIVVNLVMLGAVDLEDEPGEDSAGDDGEEHTREADNHAEESSDD